jgi:hypothetical protein
MGAINPSIKNFVKIIKLKGHISKPLYRCDAQRATRIPCGILALPLFA